MTTPPDIQEAIIAEPGHALIVGGPGSGKTTIALHKAAARIKAGLAPGQAVLFLSFSNAAIARLAQAARDEATKGAMTAAEQASISMHTMHSFFWSVLKCHAYLLGAKAELTILAPHDERAMSSGAKEEDPVAWAEWVKRRDELFLDEGRIAFDLFAPKTLALLQSSKRICKLVAARFPLVVVDEAQDTGDAAWACIRELAAHSQVVCLADIEQQIFDHLPGVGPQRLSEIKAGLQPREFSLGSVNNRSPGTQIAEFANDVLSDQLRKTSYSGVAYRIYDPKTAVKASITRSSIGMISNLVIKATGAGPDSCAILCTNGKGVAAVAAALSADPPIPHRIVFDETGAMLAGRIAAFLLEPKAPTARVTDCAILLEMLALLHRSTGAVTRIKQAQKCREWAAKLRSGIAVKTKLVVATQKAIDQIGATALSGEPKRDWLSVKHLLRDCGEAALAAVANDLDYLVAFNRGRRLAAGLAQLWSEHGAYVRARQTFDAALAQEALLGSTEDLSGIHIMTIHRSKGKQFDGVVLVREGVPGADGKWRSSFVWREDSPPYARSRKVLRVGITRARKQVLIVSPAYPACPLLQPTRP